MPKKTKKDKRRSDHRRHAPPQPPQLPSADSPHQAASSLPTAYAFRYSGVSKKHVSPVTIDEFQSIRRDIVRTLILAAFFILLELAIYWKFTNT